MPKPKQPATPGGTPPDITGDLRNRAVKLLEACFADADPTDRRSAFHSAFAGLPNDPSSEIVFDQTSTSKFAAHAVERLLAYGYAARGRHSLSLLIDVLAQRFGRRPDLPDLYHLPRELDAQDALPLDDEVRRHLESLIARIQDSYFTPLAATAITQPPASQEDEALAEALANLDQEDPNLVRLSFAEHPDRHAAHPAQAPETRPYGNILDAFAEVPHAALLGEPGSGKSTTLRRLAVNLAQAALSNPRAPLPLLAEMGKWTELKQSLAAFLASPAAAPEIGWALPALMRSGGGGAGSGRPVVLLLDGVNEMPTGEARADKVNQLRGLVREARSPACQGTRVFVSCRQDDYTGDLNLGLDTLTLEPLSPPRIRAAVHNRLQVPKLADRFFWQLAGDERLEALLRKWEAAGATEEQFWAAKDPRDHQNVYGVTTAADDQLWRDHIGNPRSLIRLAANPFMLTMLFKVWGRRKCLPENRGQLFAGFIDVLMSKEDVTQQESNSLLDGLAALAWQMQTQGRSAEGQQEEGEASVLTVLPRAKALSALDHNEPLLKKALDATILEGADQIRFRHQLLQEYFAAQALQREMKPGSAAQLWPPDRWWHRNGWEVAAVLLAGLHSDDCTPVIRWLADAQPDVASQCLAQSGAGPADKTALLAELQSRWQPRLTAGLPPERAAVGRALGRLGLDDRKGVGVVNNLPDIDWVKVEDFHMARYPVTNAQFKAFIDATSGYRNDRWWQPLTEPNRDYELGWWTEPNSPRERVSWHEAMAFCAWLSHELGFEVRLPTEEEWQRAAAGRTTREYPWENGFLAGHANTSESGIGRTCAVGLFPEGASEDGVLDLSGNVWDWCLNESKSPKNIQPGGTLPRVLRGGSWVSSPDGARVASRLNFDPGDRSYNVGFRVVCSSPIAGR